MDLLLLLLYAGLCVVIFKVFKIPLNKWTVPTAILGGIVMLKVSINRALWLFGVVQLVTIPTGGDGPSLARLRAKSKA